MGDASLPPVRSSQSNPIISESEVHPRDRLREVNVLVTGFGSFKSFATNPSYLIAASLSRSLDPESPSASAALKYLDPRPQHPIRGPDSRPYKVNIYVYPAPVRVAYDVVREMIPRLVVDPTTQETSVEFTKPQSGFDYVLHIGMAAGRENYTMETVAHRDHYKLKDVDELDGSRAECYWRSLNLPEVLEVGWNKEDVLSRWEALTRRREEEYEAEEMAKAGWTEGSGSGSGSGLTLVESVRMRSLVFLGKGRRAMVKLSRDAGRYLCEFIFYTSLVTRWREARDAERETPDSVASSGGPTSKEKIGKVSFLHVPGGTMPHDIARGVRVAESAILAIVGSWEDGFRNPDVYRDGHGERANAAAVNSSMYEQQGTGDR